MNRPTNSSEHDKFLEEIKKLRPNGPVPWQKCKHEKIVINNRKPIPAWKFIASKLAGAPVVYLHGEKLDHEKEMKQHYCRAGVYGVIEYVDIVAELAIDQLKEEFKKKEDNERA